MARRHVLGSADSADGPVISERGVWFPEVGNTRRE